jgi:hypothetical protein
LKNHGHTIELGNKIWEGIQLLTLRGKIIGGGAGIWPAFGSLRATIGNPEVSPVTQRCCSILNIIFYGLNKRDEISFVLSDQ